MKKAIYYFELSSNQNDSDAQYNLGVIYLKGRGCIEKDIDKTKKYFKHSTDGANHKSQFCVGIYFHLYLNYFEKAIFYYKKASCFKIPGSKNNLGVLNMEMGENEKNEFKKRYFIGIANEYFMEAISEKDMLAVINLSLIYNASLLGTKNEDKTIELLNKYFMINNHESETEEEYSVSNILNKDNYNKTLKINNNLIKKKGINSLKSSKVEENEYIKSKKHQNKILINKTNFKDFIKIGFGELTKKLTTKVIPNVFGINFLCYDIFQNMKKEDIALPKECDFNFYFGLYNC